MQYFGKKSVLSATVASTLILFGGLAACGKSESSASLMAEAKQFQAKGDNKSAIIQLKNAVLKNPEDAQARLLLGTIYVNTGEPASAEKELRKAKTLGATDAAVAVPLAQALLAQQQFQKVIDETAAGAGGKDAALLTVRGDALLALGKGADAKAAYDAALAAKPDTVGAMLGLSRLALSGRDVAGATVIADDAVAKNPASPEAWLFKGDLLRATGKSAEALAAYDKVLALDPAHRSANVEKANVNIALGKFDDAKRDLDAARKATPNSLMISYTQALLDFSQAKHAAALESLQKILRAAPDHMPSILMAGASELALGSHAQAEQHLKQYLEKFPDNRYARKLMATTLLKLGRTADAQAALAPALRGDGANDPQLLALAGEASLQSRDFAKATDYFQQASALAPQTAGLHTALAQSRLGQGDGERAVTELELATKLDTKNSKAGVLLVLTELRLKHLDKALAAVNRLETEQPADAMIKNLKGGVLLNKGDLAGARASFEQALVLQPAFFPAVSNLAQMALKDKHPEQAKQRLSAFSAQQPKSVDALNALAGLAAGQGQMAEATGYLEKAVAENPDAVPPALTLIAHYLRIGEKQKALTLARKSQVAHADVPELLDLLGQAQVATGDFAAALDSYSKLAGMAPKAPLVQLHLASIHLQMKNEAAAADDLKKAVALQPDFLDAQLGQIQLAMHANKGEQALAISHDIQKQRPKESIGFSVEGDILQALKKAGPALAAYEKAYELNKTAPLMIKVHGMLRQAGRQKDGDARLAQFQREHPGDQLIAMYVAEGNIAAKQYDVASKQLAEVVKANPKNAAALNNLAWLYSQQKDARALPTAEQALQAAPDSPAILDTVGVILVDQGNTARGLPLLQKAVDTVPANAEFRFHLASGMAKAGDKAGARKQLEKLLVDNKDFSEIDNVRALLKQL